MNFLDLNTSTEEASNHEKQEDSHLITKGKNPKLELLRKTVKTDLLTQPQSYSSLENPSPSIITTDTSPFSEDQKPIDSESTSPFHSRLDRFRNLLKSSLFIPSPRHQSFSHDYDGGGATSEKHFPSTLGITKSNPTPERNFRQAMTIFETNDQNEDLLEKETEGQTPSHFDDTKDVVPVRCDFIEARENEAEELKKNLGIEDNPFIHFIKGDFSDYYKEGKTLGEGSTGVVKKCTRVNGTEAFAVKIVKYRGDSEVLILIIQEFENLRKLNHKNVMKVYELYVDYYKNKVYTIMELSECKEMFEVLHDLGHYSEAVASRIFKQILSGLNYLHLNGVCHRDLKPNNILVSKDGKTVKIADFNVSKFTKKQEGKLKYSSLSTENHRMWTHTGTIAFTAPEVFLDSEYTEIVDSWSAGVVLYMMLCGYQPFHSEYAEELIEMIQAGKYEFHPEHWDNISDQAKDLIKHCLDVNYKTRYTPSQALMHPWITNHGKVPDVGIYNTKENFRVYYKNYSNGKNSKIPEHLKKMQVTSPSFAVTSPFVDRIKKRAGTTNPLHNNALSKLYSKPMSTEKEINNLHKYIKKISEGEHEAEQEAEGSVNEVFDDDSFEKSLDYEISETKSEKEFDGSHREETLEKVNQEELEKKVFDVGS